MEALKNFCLCTFLICNVFIASSNSEVRSQLEKINSAKNPTEIFSAYKNIIQYYKLHKIDSAFYYADVAEQYFVQNQHPSEELKLIAQKGHLLIHSGKLEEAKAILLKHIDRCFEIDSSLSAGFYLYLSDLYEKQVKNDSAYLMEKNYLKFIGTVEGRAYAYGGLTDLSLKLGLTDASKYYLSELEARLDSVNKMNKIIFYHELRTNSLWLKDAKRFTKYENLLIDAYKIKDVEDLASYHIQFANFEHFPPLEKEDFLKRCLIENEKNNFPLGLVFNINLLAQELLNQNRIQEAILLCEHYLNKKEWIKKVEWNHRLSLLYKYQTLLYRNNQIKDAYEVQEKVMHLKDSITELSNKALAYEMEEKFKTVRLEKDMDLQRLKIAQRTTERNILIFSSLALLGLGFALYSRFKNKQKIQRQLEELQVQRIEKLEKEKKITNMVAMIEGQEKERIRIAKDLHDGLGGLLSTVKAYLGKIETEIEHLENVKIYDTAQSLMDNAVEEVRRISHNLMPNILRVQGIKAAAKQLARQLEEVHGIKTEFEAHGLEERLSETQEVFLLRILQEIITNIIKHSQATEVIIQMYEHADSIQLMVEDNGIGFTEVAQKGIGLKSIESRVHHLGGEVDIDSRVGVGTTININLEI